ncbi:OmpA family protein [Neorhizobium alkalisoli]|uniref:Outer membrane protein OmpA-like peptidoglycan-associated protein n=1 Tax=Neorhizobium alkalisoli TaxID=528178 RepID=A0A561QH95_9HYPH|nr:OmpA family protein [Neorhizobium alkalisoli]TWF49745.1 outer membrane protein OmpA-like peptidoglycan-associated protein [Neorhizobium alkalisoli]
MSNKFRLFASVAVPLLSLPALMQPAFAAPPVSGIEIPAAQGNDVIRVQQQIIQPGDNADDSQQRRKKPQEKGAQQGQPDEQRPARPQRNAQGADDGGAQERPQRRPQSADQQPGAERPQRNQPGAAGGNDAAPQRPQRQQAAPADAPDATRPAKPQRDAQPRDAQPRDTQQRPAAPDRSNTMAPREDNNGAFRNAGPDDDTGQGKPPVTNKAPDKAPAPPKPAAQAPAPTKPAAPDRAATPDKAAPPAADAKPRPPQGADDQQPPARPPRQQNATGQQPDANGRPPRQDANGQQPDANGRPPRQNAAGQEPDANGRPPQMNGNAPQQPDGTSRPPRPQSADGQQTPPARPPAGPGDPQQAGGNRPAQPPRTPQDVDRARQIARDPAAARPGETVVLPVENGAAVLDSDKRPTRPRNDPNDPGRPRNDPQRDPSRYQDQAGRPLPPPRSDADAQARNNGPRFNPDDVRAMNDERGQRLDRRPQFDRPQGWDYDNNFPRRDDGRVIISIDNQPVVRHDDSRRFYDGDRQPEYDRLSDDRVREVIVRPDGTRIITVRNRYGEIIQRSRVVRGGQEYVLYYSPEIANETRGPDYVWRDPGDDLPPMRLSVPLDDYIIDTSRDPNRDYYQFLEQPPVENVERVYSLDEVRYSARIRDKVRRIDLDTITFATGSAEVPMSQAGSLRKVADAINKVLQKDPSETFLIEGHTDAVGSDQSNLVLSDQRAESVARVLSDAFGIPPENLTTQGYGEQYLKVQTDGPNAENRRVTIRRITPLVRPVASR